MFKSKQAKFDANKCKVQLKMLGNRFKLLMQKKTNLAKQQKREVAMLLRDDKEANARILVEHIIREDYTLESYELLRQHAELVIARFNVLVVEQELKPEIAEAVCSLLYGGYLLASDVPELHELNKLFTAKYGTKYAQEVIEHKEKYLNQRLVRVLTNMQVPDPSVVELYLTEIAKAYSVDWTPNPGRSAAAQHVSATLGVPLPMPGMPIASETPNASAEPIAADDAPTWGIPLVHGGPSGGPSGGPALPAASPTVPSATPPLVFASDPSRARHFAFSVTLLKEQHGFGITLDAESRLIGLKPGSEAERCGLLQVGDLVVALNGQQVDAEHPLKSVAVDVGDGEQATFSLLRPEAPHASEAANSAAEVQHWVSMPSVQMPPMPVEPLPPLAPPVPEDSSSGAVLPGAESIVNLHPEIGAYDPPPAVQPAPAAEVAPATDDLLAQRLAALKRF